MPRLKHRTHPLTRRTNLAADPNWTCLTKLLLLPLSTLVIRLKKARTPHPPLSTPSTNLLKLYLLTPLLFNLGSMPETQLVNIPPGETTRTLPDATLFPRWHSRQVMWRKVTDAPFELVIFRTTRAPDALPWTTPPRLCRTAVITPPTWLLEPLSNLPRRTLLRTPSESLSTNLTPLLWT